MIIETFSGHENWRDHLAKFHVFVSHPSGATRSVVVPSRAGGLPSTRTEPAEQHIGVVSRNPASHITQVPGTGSNVQVSAKVGRDHNEVGYWVRSSYEVPEGVILKVFGQRKSGAFGAPMIMANQFIRIRAEAALRRLNMALSTAPDARLSSVFVMSRFDLITFDEAKAAGAPVMEQFKGHSSPAMVSRLFTTEVVESEISRPVVVEQRSIPRENGEAPVIMPVRRRLRGMVMNA